MNITTVHEPRRFGVDLLPYGLTTDDRYDEKRDQSFIDQDVQQVLEFLHDHPVHFTKALRKAIGDAAGQNPGLKATHDIVKAFSRSVSTLLDETMREATAVDAVFDAFYELTPAQQQRLRERLAS